MWACAAARCGVFARDVFGCPLRRRIKAPTPETIVLPRFFPVEQLHFARQDDGRALPNRASEDITSPEDVRAYREGDSMKRIHWKLSLRKRELLVRRFEVPAPPDTLILMDCSDPVGAGQVEDGEMKLRDTPCERRCRWRAQMADGNSVRVPLYGAQASEFMPAILRSWTSCARAGLPAVRVASPLTGCSMWSCGACAPSRYHCDTTRLTPQMWRASSIFGAQGPMCAFIWSRSMRRMLPMRR